jgi:hypothetical protein
MLARSGGLAETMSRYLIQQISEKPAIKLHCNTEIMSLDGDTQLQRVRWIDKTTGETSSHENRHVFIMAGHRRELSGCAAVLLWMKKGSSSRDEIWMRLAGPSLLSLGRLRALRRCWTPVFPVCLRWVMFDRVTSSAWLRQWGKEQYPCTWYTALLRSCRGLRSTRTVPIGNRNKMPPGGRP